MEQSLKLQMDKVGYTVEGTYWQVERIADSMNNRREVIDIDGSPKENLPPATVTEHDLMKRLGHMEVLVQKLSSKLDDVTSHNTQVSLQLHQVHRKINDTSSAMAASPASSAHSKPKLHHPMQPPVPPPTASTGPVP